MWKTTIIILLICSYSVNGQKYKKLKSRNRHSEKIIDIATTNDFFATSSYDKSVIVWNYEGKIIFRYKLTSGKANSLTFLPHSNSLLIGLTEKDNNKNERHIIQKLDASGNTDLEFIDSTLNQEFVNKYYEKNSSGVKSAINDIKKNFPSLKIDKDVQIPQVKKGLSHIELVQDISVSPDNKSIISIDKFNILKIWDLKGRVKNSFQIENHKKDTEIYSLSDSTILITPNIIFNINSRNTKIIKGFQKYSSVPFGNMVYFHFDYNADSRVEKLYNLNSSKHIDLNEKQFYTCKAAKSDNKIALLGFDGLVRVINEKGTLLSVFGKDRNEEQTFRGERIKSYSKICALGFSPNGKHIVTGSEFGKIIIWKIKN